MRALAPRPLRCPARRARRRARSRKRRPLAPGGSTQGSKRRAWAGAEAAWPQRSARALTRRRERRWRKRRRTGSARWTRERGSCVPLQPSGRSSGCGACRSKQRGSRLFRTTRVSAGSHDRGARLCGWPRATTHLGKEQKRGGTSLKCILSLRGASATRGATHNQHSRSRRGHLLGEGARRPLTKKHRPSHKGATMAGRRSPRHGVRVGIDETYGASFASFVRPHVRPCLVVAAQPSAVCVPHCCATAAHCIMLRARLRRRPR